MLEIAHLRKSFRHGKKRLKVIDDFSLHTGKTEFVSIIGPSGCGKTTLLRLIAGLNKPDKGTIHAEGKSIKGPTSKVGIVFQEYTSFPWLTVKENLEFGLKLKNIKNNSLVEHYLKRIELKKFQHAYPSTLSGGMRQRVAIARTLINNPEIILMDEPFGSLDAQTRKESQDMLLNIWKEHKKTIIFVTHDIDEAILLSDRIIVLSKTPAKMLQEYRIDFKRPREITMRNKARFFRLKEEIAGLLKASH